MREGAAEVAPGVTLRWVEEGEGPLVLLLHGFPDFSHGWRFQLPALAAAGYRAVAPDLRGYNQSSKPSGVAAYTLDVLANDVLGLLRALGGERAAAIVGHDWGGVIAWHLAARQPAALDRLVILNAPHPAAFARALSRPGQMVRSLYAVFFQLPWVPEVVLEAGGSYEPVLRALSRMVRRPGAITDADLDAHHAALAEPGALTAMLNYYRAFGRRVLRESRRGDAASRVTVPTLVVWGDRDPALSIELAHGLERWVPRLRVRHIPEAGHWVQLDAPGAVNDEIVGWLEADA